MMKKLFGLLLALAVALGGVGAALAEETSSEGPNTIPTPVYLTAHAGYIPYVTIDEQEPGVNTYTMTSTGQNHTPSLFTYDREYQVPVGGYGEDQISFSFSSTRSEGLTENVNDFFFNFGFRLKACDLPSWNQTFGIYLTFYPTCGDQGGRVYLVISDGGVVDVNKLDSDPLLVNSIHRYDKDYMDGQTHTVDITIDSDTYAIDVVLDAGTEDEVVISHLADDNYDTPDMFDPTGGYAFMAHGSTTTVTNFKVVDSEHAPVIEEPEEPEDPDSSDPSDPTDPGNEDPQDPGEGGCGSMAGGSALLAGLALILGGGSAGYLRKKRN